MRRSLYFIGILGMLVALGPAAPAAGASCETDFEARLNCWSRWIGEGTFVVTLNDALPFDGSEKDRRNIEQKVLNARNHLVVEVPAGRHTGPGGTALLLLAKTRWVDPSARVDQLSTEAVNDLKAVGACDFENRDGLCARLAGQPLRGSDLIKADPTSERSKHTYSVGASGPPLTTAPPTTRASTERAGEQKSSTSLFDQKTTALTALCALLLLLLTAFLILVRRSSHHPAPAVPRPAAPAGPAGPAATHSRASDETTTRLRATPDPGHGREVGDRPGPARTAVVRTELHPQGYVELGRVLYRAVWADPGRPPPGPGGLVDVTDARERDSDVLYAFPPDTGRHA